MLGKTLLVLVPAKLGETLPAHKITPHDVVEVRKQKGTGVCLAEAVVTRVQEKSVTVAGNRCTLLLIAAGSFRLIHIS